MSLTSFILILTHTVFFFLRRIYIYGLEECWNLFDVITESLTRVYLGYDSINDLVCYEITFKTISTKKIGF
jgi:hypothetical protein